MNDLILQLLLKIEWAGDEREYLCPACRMSRTHGHAKDCDLARRIEEAKG